MTRARITDGLALAEKATPGPWKPWPDGRGFITAELTDEDGQFDEEICIVADGWSIRQGLDGGDLPFIAYARTALPDALQTLARVYDVPETPTLVAEVYVSNDFARGYEYAMRLVLVALDGPK